jgi:hypothetical protein
MPRQLAIVVCVAALWISVSVQAQGASVLSVGDPPNASNITISDADGNGNVTITGVNNAVFPNATVAVRNLYTEQTVYVPAGITGSFSATLYGPGNTPFLISPAEGIAADLRNLPGSLPGGPAIVIYGTFAEGRIAPTTPITQLVTDGSLTDWDAYPANSLGLGFLGLWNDDSIYLAVTEFPTDYAQLRLSLRIETALYTLQFDPRGVAPAVWQEIASDRVTDLGVIAVAASQAEALELRLPIAPFAERLINNRPPESIGLLQLDYLDPQGNLIQSVVLPELTTLIKVAEQDGFVYLNSSLPADLTRFSLSGALAQGASTWYARARLASLMLTPGQTLNLELDTTLSVPNLPNGIVGLELGGIFGLQQVTDALGRPVSSGLHTNNGWATVRTSSHLAIDNLQNDVILGEVRIPAAQVIRKGGELLAGFNANLPIPADLPPGVYVPFFIGTGRIGDGTPFLWTDNGVLGEGAGISQFPLTRMPVALRIGVPEDVVLRLPWVLFYDTPSDGSRGLVAEEDRPLMALSNRVRFNSPTTILPPTTSESGQPRTYSVEPYLPNMLANSYTSSTAPLLPLLPTGRISGTLQYPSGEVNALGTALIAQYQLSTVTLDERTRFGEQSPLDLMQISTLNDAYRQLTFDEYGNYELNISGYVEDNWGNRYEGGGRYTFVVAEPLDLTPTVLSGAPFEVGDALSLGVHLSPGVPADIEITVQVFPLDGSAPTEEIFSGQANDFGVYVPENAPIFNIPGEYVIDYEVRYTDNSNRLWAASLRSAGVIATPDGMFIAHGTRGQADTDGTGEAWFNVVGDSREATLYQPYYSGDVAWVSDGRNAGIQPQLRLQDRIGTYTVWLLENHPEINGVTAERLDATDALPNTRLSGSESYTYFSYVTPSVTARQVVLGNEGNAQPLLWNGDDPLNGQIGAGTGGARTGDYLWMFSGAVTRLPDQDIRQTSIYAAGAVVMNGEFSTARVYPPYRGEAGSPTGGALFSLNDSEVNQFFHPTATQAGEVLTVGQRLSIAGYLFPPLAGQIAVTVVSPSGEQTRFNEQANAVGYIYNPTNDIVLEESGVWRVTITTTDSGITSGGLIEPPLPTGGLLGAASNTFNVYVTDVDAPLLGSNDVLGDQPFPTGSPYNFTFRPPATWSSVQAYVTVTLPSMVVEDNLVPLQGTSLRYQFNPTALAQRLPFFEGNDARNRGAASSDPVTLTFVATGTDENGIPQLLARQITIRHDRLITLE